MLRPFTYSQPGITRLILFSFSLIFSIQVGVRSSALANSTVERVYNVPIPMDYLLDNYQEVFNLNSEDNPLVGPTSWREVQDSSNKDFPEILLEMTWVQLLHNDGAIAAPKIL